MKSYCAVCNSQTDLQTIELIETVLSSSNILRLAYLCSNQPNYNHCLHSGRSHADLPFHSRPNKICEIRVKNRATAVNYLGNVGPGVAVAMGILYLCIDF